MTKPKCRSPKRGPDRSGGYVLAGKAELHLEGQAVHLEPGDAWVVPKGSAHTYKILEPFTAIEATCPPAFAHGRDED
jgi:quercetin dioxygenase-like cupin family protein